MVGPQLLVANVCPDHLAVAASNWRIVRTVKQMFRFAVQTGLVARSPFALPRSPPGPQRGPWKTCAARRKPFQWHS